MPARNPFTRAIFTIILGLAIVAAAGAQGRGSRVALVIGNAAYALNPLKNPVNDATDMAAALRQIGFTVTLLPDATRAQMEKGIRDFGNAIKGGGIGLFYYAGHGVQIKGKNYLLPVDADIQEADEVSYKAVDADLVLAKMESAGNSTNIIILDACRNNPFPGADRAVGSRGLAVVGVQPAGSYIVYATQPNATAQDGTGRNGVFTKNLLAHLKTPGLDLDLMVRRVRDGVKAETGGAQVPWSNSSLSSEGFMFVPASAAATPTPPTPSPAPAALAPSLTITRAYGSLVVSAASTGSLYLDGKAMGELPAGAEARLDNVEVGDRVVELRYPSGERETANATVRKGEGSVVSFTWKKAPTSLPVAAAPQAPVPQAVTQAGFVRLPGGTFTMGSPESEPNRVNDEVQHQVTVSSFTICQFEVTQAEWQAVMGSNPSSFKGDKLPVENVTWYAALVYCNKRSMKEGLTPCYSIKLSTDPERWGYIPTGGNAATWDEAICNFGANGYRLPTEAEWEYACRAGTKTATAFGDSLASTQANFDGNFLYNVSSKGDYLQKTAPVGSYPANAWGLRDMHGNVWEWCWDWYGEYAAGAASDPVGASSGKGRVLRGGSWFNYGHNLRSAFRNDFARFGARNGDCVGLRVVRSGR